MLSELADRMKASEFILVALRKKISHDFSFFLSRKRTTTISFKIILNDDL